MNARAILLCTAMVLPACSSSQSDRTATATPQATALATPRPPMSAFKALVKSHPGQTYKVVTPQVSATGADKTPTATITPTGAAVTPPSGASEAAKAAGAEARKVTIPSVRAVPVGGVMAAPGPSVRAVPAGGVMAAPSIVTSASGSDTLPPGVPYASDTDPVRIVSYVLSSTVIHPGDDITGDVVTSSNAASVTARVGTFSVAVPKVAQGKFHLQMKMPSVPLPPGDAKLIITAIRTDGKSTTREIAITVAL
jgi:hypothetical protein